MTDVTPLYATVGSNDPARAMAFYGELLGTLGWNKVFDNPAGGAFYGHPNTGMFAVVTPFNEKTATVGNGTMAGFALATNAAVDASKQAAAHADKAADAQSDANKAAAKK